MVAPKIASKTASKRKSAVWFLEYGGSEFGPLSEAEMEVVLKSGRLRGHLNAWRKGMTDWQSVQQIPELMKMLGAGLYGPGKSGGLGGLSRKTKLLKQLPKEPPKKAADRRGNRRVPLVAAVRFSIGEPPSRSFQGPYLGICRDINPDGMLILSNQNPTSTSRVRVEVTPLGPTGFEVFIAEAKLVRILPDKWGFSIKFLKLRDRAREAIEKYMANCI